MFFSKKQIGYCELINFVACETNEEEKKPQEKTAIYI